MGGSETGGNMVKRIAGETSLSICTKRVATREEAEALARHYFNKMAMELITGEGSCIGNLKVKAGQVVELKELGKRFSGLYYVTSSKHNISEKGYTTYFNVKRSAI